MGRGFFRYDYFFMVVLVGSGKSMSCLPSAILAAVMGLSVDTGTFGNSWEAAYAVDARGGEKRGQYCRSGKILFRSIRDEASEKHRTEFRFHCNLESANRLSFADKPV
jgi:hypothetical protein